MDEISVYDKLMAKVDRDFSLLSVDARAHIKSMIYQAMTDGYDRGVASTRPPRPPRPPMKTPRPSSD